MKVAIIPAAGRGVRFRDLGKQYPKCLLPYKNKPIIQHTVDKIFDTVDEIRIVVGHQGDEIRKYFSENPNDKVKIIELDTTGPQGPPKSMFCALTGKEESVMMLLSDSVFKFPTLPRDYTYITAMEVPDYSRWCMVDSECNFYDKPATKPPTNMAVSGFYYFTNPKLLYYSCLQVFADYGDSPIEMQFSHVFEHYKKTEEMKVYGHQAKEIIDFGTLEEYYQNKGIGNSRAFNNVFETDEGTVIKKSETMPEKVLAEAFWMQHSPKHFQKYIPRVFETDVINGQFEMEKITAPTLRELYLYIDKSYESWKMIFTEVDGFLNQCKKTKKKGNFWAKMVNKTRQRAETRDAQFAEKLERSIKDLGIWDDTTYYHGDLHFNNMFFTFSTRQIKFVDPRGEFQGHYFYDIAKLYHSVYGMYDYIDEGLYSVSSNDTLFYDKGNGGVRDAFEDVILSKLSKEEAKFVRLLTASLFLSMIPLHYENKQNQELFYDEYLRLSE